MALFPDYHVHVVLDLLSLLGRRLFTMRLEEAMSIGNTTGDSALLIRRNSPSVRPFFDPYARSLILTMLSYREGHTLFSQVPIPCTALLPVLVRMSSVVGE